METSGVVYEVDCDNYFKKYTCETGRKWKERMKEQKNDGEKSRKDKKKKLVFHNIRKLMAIPLRWIK